MQLKNRFRVIFFASIFFVNTSFAYDCIAKELPMKSFRTKKEAFAQLRITPRQDLVSGALYELTTGEISKKTAKKVEVIISYLENSDVDANYRSFFKLLVASSEINSSTPKKLKLAEVCEILGKVNALAK